MQFIGEHLLPGKIGHFFALLFFSASLVAVIAYFKAANAKTREEEKDWRRLARRAFLIDVVSVFAVFGTIVYIIANHLFEYNFAWEHSSRSMPLQYLLSCIWEAQEGSFLLWTIWVCILGLILIRKAGKWESPVMTVISFTHLSLATMIMGLYFFGNKVGFNPFILVRQMDFAANAPIFSRADYMNIPQMQDGQGLNALLQNYWMVIHPPVLFLGFSSTVVPFAYAIAGLWKRQWDWTRAALPWTLFSACILGTGIMMGAAWAYEALSFGGYWAWDPVENASLVPWLVMIAGLHTMVVYNATGHSLRATHFFLITQFILVLYSTFLTRSGILGDTSVHAFVDSGMNVQLAMFVFIFLFPAYGLFVARYGKIPHIVKEEATGSREFWMFIGSLVLFLSALFVIGSTSLPVFNLVTNKKVAIGDDALFAYNRIEIFIAVLIGLLTAVTQYLKYKGTSWTYLWKKIWLPTTVALVVSVLISLFGGIHYDKYGAGFLAAIHLALFAAIYSVVANAAYIRTGLNGKLRAAGPSIAHAGFGLMLVGILLSSAKKSVLSINTTGIFLPFSPESKQDPMENLTLLKGVPTDMGVYTATYVNSDSVNTRSKITYYQIHFDKKGSKEQFDLYPNYIMSTKGGGETAPNPDKYHYWNKDIFAYISATDNPDKSGDTAQFRPSEPLAPGDTAYFSKGYMVLDSVMVNPNNGRFHFAPTDTALVAKVSVITRDSMRYVAYPALYVNDGNWRFANDTVFAQNLALQFDKVEGRKVELGIKESSQMVPFVALKVLEFPQISILWIGMIIMIIGFVISIMWRRRQNALTVSR
ncbi:MAG TPA: cytochrome c biogenesis protein CcsA [Puia sp.]|jgi:cytochrome c-type biogenesis protein CcmF|nr:cytochrome c biogenesis protein CcsA [Puia sp.]